MSPKKKIVAHNYDAILERFLLLYIYILFWRLSSLVTATIMARETIYEVARNGRHSNDCVSPSPMT
jgi:hypothetical protein